MMRLHKINTIKELKEVADNRKSIIIPKSRVWNMPKPASFLIQLPGIILVKLLEQGIYIYQAKKKEE
jgi:hypothetical protein